MEKTVPTDIDDVRESEALARAFLAALDMEQTRSYLERGRQYAGLSTDELRVRYLEAGEAYFGRDDESRVREINDFSAEYRLRKENSPAYLLKDTLEAAAKRVTGFTDEDLERMQRFIEDMRQPKN